MISFSDSPGRHRVKRSVRSLTGFMLFLSVFIAAGFVSCASQRAAWENTRAEEFFNIGMAYFELGRFNDAETWLNRARDADRTMVASEYNLGRIAFETGRFGDAARHFEMVLSRDPENVMALQAAAFMRIRNGEFEEAEVLYTRVLELVPESADSGFNYALVLFGLERFDEVEETLKRYPDTLEENASSILLLARAQKAQDKVEAIDSYALWLTVHTGAANPQGILEFAQVLKSTGHYARALEQYDEAIKALTQDTATLTKAGLQFEKARILLAVDPEAGEGMEAFTLAIEEGFSDTDAIAALMEDERITSDNRDEIRRVLNSMLIRQRDAETASQEADDEDDDEDDENGESEQA